MTSRSGVSILAAGAIGLGSLGVAGAGVVLAAGHDHVIHGCVAKSSGDLRIVPATGSCGAKETSLSFNAQGPVGPAGPAGAVGPRGPAGTDASPPETTQEYGNVDAEGDLGSNNGVKSVERSDEFLGPLYTVSFAHSITSCAVTAVAGEVAGSDKPQPAFPVIFPAGSSDTVLIAFFEPTSQGVQDSVPTPFMTTATCTNVIHVQ